MIRAIATATLMTLTLASSALATNEQKCQQSLSIAASKYQLCMHVAQGKWLAAGDWMSYWMSIGKCITTYTQLWPRLTAKYAGQGTSCEGARYVDNGDGTFYDRLTRLTWEKKDDAGGIHDKDNTYTWSTGNPWKETGTAFTTFLKTLNDGSFGGSNGWRMPSIYELSTLVEPAYPNCSSPPCTTVPGETFSSGYWSSSTYRDYPYNAWSVYFYNGSVDGSVSAWR